MSLNEEKMFILKMLEEGKISSEEAARLIEALEGGAKQAGGNEYSAKNQKPNNFQDEVNKMRDRIHEWKKDFKTNYNQKDFDRMVDEFSAKTERVAKNLASTTVGFVDKMMDFVGSFVDTSAFNVFGRYETVEKSFEAVAVEGVELEIQGINGYIVVKKHLDNKIVIRSKIKSPANNVDNILGFNDDGSTVSLKINDTGNISVTHEVFLPAIRFKKIKLQTSNGRILVEDSLSQEFEASTRNSHIELMGVNSDKITVKTKNAKIQVSYVIGRDIEIDTSNSIIDIRHVKAETIKAATMNGRLFVENVQNIENAPVLKMNVKTSNDSIKVNMNDMDNRAYKVKAQTTNGGINLLIPEMTYHNINKQGMGGSFIEAESNGYDSFAEKVSIIAESTNGYIEIVK